VSHLDKWREYAAARTAADEARKVAAGLAGEQARLEQELIDAMVDAKVKSFTVDGGLTIGMRKRFDISCNQDNNDQVADWLLQTYGDIAPFQKLILYKPAVVAHLKKLDEAEQLDESALPQFLNLKKTPGVTVRGWRGAKDDE
jgi:hypothetical protein